MLKLINLLAILLGLVSFTANASYLNISKKEVTRRLRLLDYNKNYTVEKFSRYRRKWNYNIHRIDLKSTHPWTNDDLKFHFYYYEHKNKDEKRPLMIIIPPIVDITPLDKAMAHVFVTKGYNVMILKYNENINDYERPLKDFNRAMVSIITSARLMIDWAETREELDTTKIGSYGMSLGALILSIYVGVEDRIDAAVIIVGGGHVPQIMANSQQDIALTFREKRMEAEGITTEYEFQKKMEDIIIFDPMTFAHRRNKEDIYMVIGDNDTAVATKNQWMLWKAFGKPQHISYNDEHFPSILKNLFKHNLIFDYLEKRLNKEENRPGTPRPRPQVTVE